MFGPVFNLLEKVNEIVIAQKQLTVVHSLMFLFSKIFWLNSVSHIMLRLVYVLRLPKQIAVE